MNKKLFVLAGGFGTRLRSLVSDVPKPLAPVIGVAFLQYLILNWKRQGIKDIILLLQYEAEKIKHLVTSMHQSGLLGGVDIQIVIEDQPLGTGGAILNAVNNLQIHDSFLVVNADTWLSDGLKLMINAGPNSVGAKKVVDVERYGELDIREGYIQAFNEKTGRSKSGWINAGIYHLSPEIFRGYKPGDSFSIEKEVFPDIIQNGKLIAIKLEIDFIDIGIPEDYLTFCDWVLKGRVNEI